MTTLLLTTVLVVGFFALMKIALFVAANNKDLTKGLVKADYNSSLRKIGENCVSYSLVGVMGTIIAAVSAELGTLAIVVLIIWSALVAVTGYALIVVGSTKED